MGNTISTATSLTGTNPILSGALENRTDVDVCSFTTGAGNISLSLTPAAPSGNVYGQLTLYNATGTPLASATVSALVANAEAETGAGSDVYTLWPAGDYGQVNPQGTGSDGKFGFYPPAGTYQINVARSGYQPYRSPDIPLAGGFLGYALSLTPASSGDADHVIQITESGLVPGVLAARSGDVIEFVNVDTGEHPIRLASYVTAAATGQWDSGVLAKGAAAAVLSSVLPYSFELLALRSLSQQVFGVLLSLEPAVAAVAGPVSYTHLTLPTSDLV